VAKVLEPNLPAVFYQVNKAVISPAQQQNVQIAADVLKNHPTYRLQVKGYASPEGPHANNTSLGIRRADAVKDMLVKKYGIAADRIDAEGCGETDQLFETYEFNRCAILFLDKK
jgi:outer membrane protein OmpA-like peptidoglycan-associated protein